MRAPGFKENLDDRSRHPAQRLIDGLNVMAERQLVHQDSEALKIRIQGWRDRITGGANQAGSGRS